MAEVSASRFVHATPAELEAFLTPATLVECEGSFAVRETRETSEGVVVLADGGGMEIEFAFEPREKGLRYEQRRGPLERLATTLSYQAENEGARVELRSTVATGTPPRAITDRLAAWKRRGELRRALSSVAAELE
ncbi:polyketide cyclase [Halobacteriales archaeon QS_3_64_16]|nr:MAG: polyketide cyclase [Halobacteriales archaeon QS_3_64_16]